ncbi:MAG: MFS transporter, partial [Chloroflexota bacterium]
MVNHDTVKRIERALRYSSIEGMAYGVVQGAGEHFTPAYAVALGASNTQLAFLSSLPTFLGAFGQSSAARLAGLLGGRKRVVLAFAALQGLMWLPIVSVGFLFPAHRPELLIAFLALYTLFGGFISPTWGSIMAEVVPEQLRGRYFSLRSRWSTLANMFAFLVGGGLLFVLADKGPLGFALIFAVAFIFRMVSLGMLTTLFEPHHDGKSDEAPSLRTFVSQLPRTNLGKTFLYLFGVNFVVNLASPFFAPYMLRELKLDYLTYTVLDMLSIVAAVWAVTHWGAAADRVGNRKMLAAFAAFLRSGIAV